RPRAPAAPAVGQRPGAGGPERGAQRDRSPVPQRRQGEAGAGLVAPVRPRRGAGRDGRLVQGVPRGWAMTPRPTRCGLRSSGSSANLLALSCLTSPKLGDRRLRPGDEVITVAAGFPTTVNPILQNNLVPVFVDVDAATYNVDPSQLEPALSDRTRAVMIAHTL